MLYVLDEALGVPLPCTYFLPPFQHVVINNKLYCHNNVTTPAHTTPTPSTDSKLHAHTILYTMSDATPTENPTENQNVTQGNKVQPKRARRTKEQIQVGKENTSQMWGAIENARKLYKEKIHEMAVEYKT